MKLLVLLTGLVLLAAAQTAILPKGPAKPFQPGDERITASHIESVKQQGVVQVIHMSGNVTFENDAIVLHADTADYDPNSKEIAAQGDVRVQLK
jgi:lipopolysaccharide assembly outer membrane protein LptD (OstA)